MYMVDKTHPVEDGIMDTASFEKSLKERIKVDGKTGHLENNASLELREAKINLTNQTDFSKRYLTYLKKKSP